MHCPPLLCTALHYKSLHCIALNCTELHCTAIFCTAIFCTALYCTARSALHSISLHSTALHSTYCIVKHHNTLKYYTLPSNTEWVLHFHHNRPLIEKLDINPHMSDIHINLIHLCMQYLGYISTLNFNTYIYLIWYNMDIYWNKTRVISADLMD